MQRWSFWLTSAIWDNTPLTLVSDASTSTTNWWSASGTCKIGAIVNYPFSFWNVVSVSRVQANLMFNTGEPGCRWLHDSSMVTRQIWQLKIPKQCPSSTMAGTRDGNGSQLSPRDLELPNPPIPKTLYNSATKEGKEEQASLWHSHSFPRATPCVWGVGVLVDCGFTHLPNQTHLHRIQQGG